MVGETLDRSDPVDARGENLQVTTQCEYNKKPLQMYVPLTMPSRYKLHPVHHTRQLPWGSVL